MIKLTHKLSLECGCLNKTQAELLKVPWPLVQGWRDTLIGREISEDVWNKVLSLRGLKPKERKKLLKLEKEPTLL